MLTSDDDDNDIDDLSLSIEDRETTLQYSALNEPRTGHYTCVSNVTNNEVTVLVTLG